jgi:hypothetical protein
MEPLKAIPHPMTPAETELFCNVYTMFYREGNHLVSKNFRCPGGLKAARERAETHCNIMEKKLNFVQPLVSDLGREESYKLGFKIEKEVEVTK